MDKFYYSDGSVLNYRDFSLILHRLDGPAVIYDDGEKRWWQNGQLHRANGPAIEYGDVKMWYQNGKLHRVDGPAVERKNEYKAWYKNDLHHRLDGPASEYADGRKRWCINGKELNEEEFEKTILTMKLSGVY